MSSLLAGLVLGLAGTAHCAAMCGPLVLLAQARGAAGGATSAGRVWGRLAAYHVGRATTYVALGVLAGAAGDGLARGGFGRVVAVTAGVWLLLQAVLPVSGGRWALRATRPMTVAIAWLGQAARRAGLDGPVVHGALHGLLPCGMLYLAAAAAAGLGDVGHAAAFMAGFAVGTTPILGVIAVTGPALATHLPALVKRAAPVGLALVGLLLVARGVGVLPGPHGAHGAPGAAVTSPSGPAATGAPVHVH